MDFVIAIPSYNRAEKLKKQTLSYLSSQEIPPELITIFVANEEEKQKYLSVLDSATYKEIVVGKLGLHNQRNIIQEHYPLDTNILQMDDDIKKVKFISEQPLKGFVRKMFEITKKEGARLWSIYPVNNLFFCKNRTIIGKIFCVGCFFGIINKKDLNTPAVDCVEDKWRTLTCYLKDGKTVRYDGACPDTVYNARGGLYEHRLLHRTQEVKDVVNLFQNYCILKFRRDGMTAEVHWKQIIDKILAPTFPYEWLSFEL